MGLAKLSIDLEARLANLQAGLDKAGLLAERQAERMQRAFSGASKALTAAGGAIAAAFSVSVITRWVSATVDGGTSSASEGSAGDGQHRGDRGRRGSGGADDSARPPFPRLSRWVGPGDALGHR